MKDFGSHQISQAQARAEDLRQRADIDDLAGRVRTGKRQHGLMGEMKFVVVIVFDDCKAELGGERQQAQAPVGLHQHRGREIVMRRDIDGAHPLLAADFFQFIHPHALRIERNGTTSAPAKRNASRAGG